MISNEIREYLIDFFNWFPVEDRQQAIKSLIGLGDSAINLYYRFSETDRIVMEDVRRVFKDEPKKIQFFEGKSPGLRCFLWENFSNFVFDEDPNDEIGE